MITPIKLVGVFFLLHFMMSSIHAQTIEVVKIKGQVFVGQKELRPIGLKSKLSEGDQVTVKGDKSFVQLRFEDGSMILQKKGQLILKKVQSKQTLVNLLKGVIFVFKNPETKSKFNVKTKRVSLAVRGTKFYVEEGEKSYLCVCEGTVAARNAQGTIDVTKGEDLFAKDKQSLEKSTANEDMMSMALMGFDMMGVPVNK